MVAPHPRENLEVANLFDRIADLLEAQDARGFRVRAFRRAAATLRAEPRPLSEVLAEGGVKALQAMPTIGRRMAGVIEEYVTNGTCRLLDRLEGNASPEALFESVPGIGPKLAARAHSELGADSLEELELAAHDGRLEKVPGFGPRRAEAVRHALDAILRNASRRRARLFSSRDERPGDLRPGVETLLAVDQEYRERARAGELRRISPRRFNPTGEAWLPIWHGERDGWELTALYSNTARAHELGRTHDWVVIYYGDDGHEGQCTVVTERQGTLAGRRVVRGRELECERYHRGSGSSARDGTPGGGQATPRR